MRRHWFYILLSLSERERNGSAIMRDVLELTGGALKLWPVTLYGSLDELEDQGWIRMLPGPPPEAEGEGGHRKWFRITPAGRRALAREVASLDALVRAAQHRLAQAAGA